MTSVEYQSGCSLERSEGSSGSDFTLLKEGDVPCGDVVNASDDRDPSAGLKTIKNVALLSDAVSTEGQKKKLK